MIQFTFPEPTKRMSMNDRMAWYIKAERTRVWRSAAAWHARRARIKPQSGKSLVEVEFAVATNVRRDPHNQYPTIKAIVDGLVDAKVFSDDDQTKVATREPSFKVVGTKSPKVGEVTVTITPLGETS